MKSKISPKIIALGLFDSLHNGHAYLIETTKTLAQSKSVLPAVFTFRNDISAVLQSKQGVVFNYKERVLRLKKMGVFDIIAKTFNERFKNQDGFAFLDDLVKNHGAIGFTCGEDYTFGKDALYGVKQLEEYCKKNNLIFKSVKQEKINNEKISTTKIKELLKDGKIKEVNSYLPYCYQVTGKVFEDRKVGTKMGFPTINLKIEPSKIKLKNAVYKGYIYLNKKRYNALINYGARPTFDLNESLIEAHVIGFNGNLYGKTVTLYFEEYLRDIIKFSSVEELVLQLKEDIKNCQ